MEREVLRSSSSSFLLVAFEVLLVSPWGVWGDHIAFVDLVIPSPLIAHAWNRHDCILTSVLCSLARGSGIAISFSRGGSSWRVRSAWELMSMSRLFLGYKNLFKVDALSMVWNISSDFTLELKPILRRLLFVCSSVSTSLRIFTFFDFILIVMSGGMSPEVDVVPCISNWGRCNAWPQLNHALCIT